LALRLDEQRVPILGTQAKDIDNAEDREKFSAMLNRIGVDQPAWSALTSMDDINAFIKEVGALSLSAASRTRARCDGDRKTNKVLGICC